MARPSKFNASTAKAIIQALETGATYEIAAKRGGIKRETLWRWLKKGEDAKTGQFVTFRNDVKKAEANGAVFMLAIISKAARGDERQKPAWKAAAWLLERRYGYRIGGALENQKPPENKKEPLHSPIDFLKGQISQLKESMESARKSKSWQPYAALNRQLLDLFSRLRIEQNMAEEDPTLAMSDEALCSEIINAMVQLPPVLRQKIEGELFEMGSNVIPLRSPDGQ